MTRKIAVFLALILALPSVVLATKGEFDAYKELEKSQVPSGAMGTYVKPTFQYKAGNLRDPFKPEQEEVKEQKIGLLPVIKEKKPLPSLNVQGLVLGGAFPQVIINNTILKVGDKISDVSIVNIEKKGITVNYSDAEYILPAPADQPIAQSQKGAARQDDRAIRERIAAPGFF
ncbi:MAG: general secretion pathway protein GspB [Candidatus Omnitrophica bacterium]|nr:general secretion pathway protein GspB [Candidatus Omnitrophota bacterium]MBU1870063.1 general secretion pathway protein GspB [Candidatus Omnitrophota bacterium]